MKVKELIKTLSEFPQDLEVFHMTAEEGGLSDITSIRLAEVAEDEIKELTGDKFVFIE